MHIFEKQLLGLVECTCCGLGGVTATATATAAAAAAPTAEECEDLTALTRQRGLEESAARP
jgi:hypothetical protein